MPNLRLKVRTQRRPAQCSGGDRLPEPRSNRNVIGTMPLLRPSATISLVSIHKRRLTVPNLSNSLSFSAWMSISLSVADLTSAEHTLSNTDLASIIKSAWRVLVPHSWVLAKSDADLGPERISVKARLITLARPKRSKEEYNSAVYVLLVTLDCFLETKSMTWMEFSPRDGPSRSPRAITPDRMARPSKSSALKELSEITNILQGWFTFLYTNCKGLRFRKDSTLFKCIISFPEGCCNFLCNAATNTATSGLVWTTQAIPPSNDMKRVFSSGLTAWSCLQLASGIKRNSFT